MSETDAQPPAPKTGWLEPGPANIQVIYVLYLLGFVIGISALVGIVMAYLNRGQSAEWLETHYTWAIRTFWIGVLYAVISTVLMVVGIGFLLMLLVAVWLVVRVVIGLQRVSRNEPISNPLSWVL
ncbi:DUF4870 domain-containing protein [Chelativorans sp. Marseille-P2723]|uniref:DUF4870 family protein n=1 Tax=Chelativorans sp. Marseille-P2723 TaxID=2709133 RepID=UPI00156EB2FB|nr:DUF4870 domain-containing protein [Chelativorans sp. Marseille-P2723]